MKMRFEKLSTKGAQKPSLDMIISGGLGFIGKNLLVELMKTGMRYEIIDRICGYDVCSTEVTHEMAHCSTFVHLAAFTNVRESLKWPSVAVKQNLSGTANCLEHARKVGAHFIFTSSMGAPQALSPYSASKLACEAVCNAYRESYDMDITVLRLSNVYGPYSKHKGSVISKFINHCLDHQPLEIYGDGKQTRDFIYVEDVCKTIMQQRREKLIRVASGITTPIIEIAERIRNLSSKLINFRPDIVFKDAVQGEINQVDSRTDISQTVLLEKGLKSTFEWFKSTDVTP